MSEIFFFFFWKYTVDEISAKEPTDLVESMKVFTYESDSFIRMDARSYRRVSKT